MTGTILLPGKFTRKHYITDRYHLLFESIAKRFSWNILVGDDIDPRASTDVVMTFKCPQHDDCSRGMKVLDLPSSTKVIIYTVDLQSYGCTQYDTNIKLILERANLILCPYGSSFQSKYPQYHHKLVVFPQFFGPTERYVKLHTAEKQIKCLVAGSTCPDVYPLRYHLVSKVDKALIKGLEHPNQWHFDDSFNVAGHIKLHSQYASMINSHFCAATTCSKFRYVLAKHFEIPACNTLMLSDRCPDLDRLGFIPGEHYIEIDSSNAESRIRDVIQNTAKYRKTIINGRRFVMQTGTIEKRVLDFAAALKKL